MSFFNDVSSSASKGAFKNFIGPSEVSKCPSKIVNVSYVASKSPSTIVDGPS